LGHADTIITYFYLDDDGRIHHVPSHHLCHRRYPPVCNPIIISLTLVSTSLFIIIVIVLGRFSFSGAAHFLTAVKRATPSRRVFFLPPPVPVVVPAPAVVEVAVGPVLALAVVAVAVVAVVTVLKEEQLQQQEQEEEEVRSINKKRIQNHQC
jgi:hypothetical protein